MTPEVKSPVMIYTESTPNPETLKFVTNRMLYKGTADFREESLAKEWSPLATAIFEMPYVKGVYICNNFVTVTKEFNYEWQDIMLKTKEFVKKCVEDGMTVVKDGFAESIEALAAENKEKTYSAEDSEIVQRIIDLIETYVKPAVEMDGGNIEFVAFTNGIVTIRLQGSCSGCPSSTVTLKSGIEGMLQRMVPEVKEVVAEMG